MPIYHFHAKIISRAAGQSSVASAAYRAGERLTDERLDQTFDYTRKERVEHSEIAAPGDAPDWVYDRQTLFNRVEAEEARKDAQLCREIEASLPRELSLNQQLALVRGFLAEQCVSRGQVADWSIHSPDARDGQAQPHVHVMLTMRHLTAEGFGGKAREWNDKAVLEGYRKAWADHTNQALADAGIDAKVDHRSLAEQGIDRPAEVHLGKYPTGDRLAYVAAVRELRQAQAEEHQATAEVIDLQKWREILHPEEPEPTEPWQRFVRDARDQAGEWTAKARNVRVPRRGHTPQPRSPDQIATDRRREEAGKVALIKANAGKLTELRQQGFSLGAWLFHPVATMQRHQARLENEWHAQRALEQAEDQERKVGEWLDNDDGQAWARRRAGRERDAHYAANAPADQAQRQVNQYVQRAAELNHIASSTEAAAKAMDDPRLPDELRQAAERHLAEVAKFDPTSVPAHLVKTLDAIGDTPAALDRAERRQEIMQIAAANEAKAGPAPAPAPPPPAA